MIASALGRAESRRPTVAIVGGGFSGGAVAYHLADRMAAAEGRLIVYEPRARLGAGLAYDTHEPAHRINVPADKMSLVPSDENHFVRWLETTRALSDDPAARLPDGRSFPRRSVFGEYVDIHLRRLVDQGLIEHRRARVIEVVRFNSHWKIGDAAGGWLEADTAVIATTHPPPRAPRELLALSEDPRLITDATAPNALAQLRPEDRILIVGTGLTMADIVAALHARRHRGPILAISRRGVRSRGHSKDPVQPLGDFRTAPERSALLLLRRIRREIRAASYGGQPWQATLDAVRRQGRDIWTSLPVEERRKLIGRLRPYWDAHRFRLAPMVENAVDELIGRGCLRTLAASLGEVESSDDGVRVRYRLRGASAFQNETFDRIIVATGPSHEDVLSQQPALKALNGAGYVNIDPVGLGLWCDTRARLLDRCGMAVPGLLLAGPLARGAFGELMGLAEVADFSVFVADEIAHELSVGHRGRRGRTANA